MKLTLLWIVMILVSGIAFVLLLNKNEHAKLFSGSTVAISIISLVISSISGGMQHDETIAVLEKSKNETIAAVQDEFDRTFEERVEQNTDVILKDDIFLVQLQMRTKRDDTWQKVLDLNNGDEIEFQLHYKNNGYGNVENVLMQVSLPSGFTYIENSATLYNSSYPDGISYQDLTTEAVNVGDYKSYGDAYMRFQVKIQGDNSEEGKTHRFITWAKVTAGSEALLDHTQVYVVMNNDN